MRLDFFIDLQINRSILTAFMHLYKMSFSFFKLSSTNLFYLVFTESFHISDRLLGKQLYYSLCVDSNMLT